MVKTRGVSLLVDMQVRDHHLHCKASGPFDLDQATARFRQMLFACRIGRVGGVLVDFRGLRGEMSATHRILYVIAAVDEYRQHLLVGATPLSFAYLLDSLHVSEYRPGVALAQREQVEVLLTTEFQDATRWLNHSGSTNGGPTTPIDVTSPRW